MTKNKLVKQFDEKTKKTKILEQIEKGLTPNQIAQKLNVTRKYIDQTLKEELARTDTPDKILAMRDQQSAQIQTHTPRLAQRFIRQTDIQNRLVNKYEQLLDQDEKGEITYATLYDQYIQDGLDPETAYARATNDIAIYRNDREQISKEIERTAKLADQSYNTYLKQQERLAKLHGLDTPQQHHMLISRTDHIKVELQNEILATQKQLQKENTIEAEIVETEED